MTEEEFFKRYNFSIRKDKIGGGSFGTVYRAYDDVLNRTVAIKVSEVRVIDGKEFSLLDEFKALKDLEPHRNIANYQELYNFEMHNGIFDYAIMQYYKDGNLSAFIKTNPTLKKEQIAIDLLEGIEHLHNNKVVHRDLKPSNILIVKKETEVIPKITDFGLSKKADPNAGSILTNSFGGGTLVYSSPEQLKGEELRFNTDLWSYGVIIYELFTGEELFKNIKTSSPVDSDIEIIKQVNSKDLTDCILELPKKWQAVGRACLDRNPDKRVRNAEKIKSILRGEDLEKEETTKINTVKSKKKRKEKQQEETTIGGAVKSKKERKENITDKEKQPQEKPKKEEILKEVSTIITKKTKWSVYALFFLSISIGVIIWHNNSPTEPEPETQIDTPETTKDDLENKTEQELEKIIANAPKMVRVAGGTFTMGSSSGDSDKQPHSVTLSSYYIGKTEVTVAQYRYYCRATGTSMPEEPNWGWNDNDPIVRVSWNDAIKYCKWLSKELGKKITLPTEAQWEFAARGGNKSKGYKYSGSNALGTVGWHYKNSNSKVHRVATKKANELGLYDMSGNVWEWCLDWYGENYYSNSPKRNPQGPQFGNFKVPRGGNWLYSASFCRVADRNLDSPDSRISISGFRVVSL